MAGRIYPPWAILEYGEVTKGQLKNEEDVEFEFKVDYSMKTFESEKDIEVRKHHNYKCLIVENSIHRNTILIDKFACHFILFWKIKDIHENVF